MSGVTGMWSGAHSTFLGLELKYPRDPDGVPRLIEIVPVADRPRALFPRLLIADQNLTVPRA